MRDPERNDMLLAGFRAGDERALDDLAETYGSKIYQLAFRYRAEQGRRRGGHPGRAVQGVPQGSAIVPRRRGAVVLDLSDHLQRGDVAAAHGAVSSARRATSVRPRRPAVDDDEPSRRGAGSPTGRTWRTSSVLRSQLRRACSGDPRSSGDLPRARHAARHPGHVDRGGERDAAVKDQTLKSRLHRGRLILRKQLADFAGGSDAAPADLRHIAGSGQGFEVQDGREGNSYPAFEPCQPSRLSERIALSSATRSTTLSVGNHHALDSPPRPSRTGSAAVRVRVPARVVGPTKQLTVRRDPARHRVDRC